MQVSRRAIFVYREASLEGSARGRYQEPASWSEDEHDRLNRPGIRSEYGLGTMEEISDLDRERRSSALAIIQAAMVNHRPDLSRRDIASRSETVLADVVLLARCAKTKCLVTYGNAIELRGHGNQQNGRWLDEVYAYAISPFGFPDLTLLIVNKATKRPSDGAFEARRTILSNVGIDDVPQEQRRCVWFEGYEDVLGQLEPIPSHYHLARLGTPEPAKDRELKRAVSNALQRIGNVGIVSTSMGKEYVGSLARADLTLLVSRLWDSQAGRCALTGQRFETRLLEDGGVQDDRVSLDRIDNAIGYAEGNIQLVTQFANRARGILSVDEAKRRLVQFD